MKKNCISFASCLDGTGMHMDPQPSPCDNQATTMNSLSVKTYLASLHYYSTSLTQKSSAYFYFVGPDVLLGLEPFFFLITVTHGYSLAHTQ